jgi:RNA recognition motif-containing protein
VRNVEYSTTENDIRKLFDPFGEIKSVFDLIAKRGLVFVSYVLSDLFSTT